MERGIRIGLGFGLGFIGTGLGRLGRIGSRWARHDAGPAHGGVHGNRPKGLLDGFASRSGFGFNLSGSAQIKSDSTKLAFEFKFDWHKSNLNWHKSNLNSTQFQSGN